MPERILWLARQVNFDVRRFRAPQTLVDQDGRTWLRFVIEGSWMTQPMRSPRGQGWESLTLVHATSEQGLQGILSTMTIKAGPSTSWTGVNFVNGLGWLSCYDYDERGWSQAYDYEEAQRVLSQIALSSKHSSGVLIEAWIWGEHVHTEYNTKVAGMVQPKKFVSSPNSHYKKTPGAAKSVWNVHEDDCRVSAIVVDMSFFK
jgi:hypothetical protein